MEKTIFLTGGTGFLGRSIAATLLRNERVAKVVLLVRARSDEEATRRAIAAVTGADASLGRERLSGRLIALPGDLTRSGLGLDGGSIESLTGRVTEVIHCAGCVDFGLPLEETRNINLDGTRRVMELSMTMPNLRRVSHIGTAYVAGERNGMVYERDLDSGQAFGNTYEQAKFEAEQYVRSIMPILPVDVLRPSIVVGNSRTGETNSFKMLYAPLKAIYQGLVRVLPGSADTKLDVVPVDFVARAICDITLDGNPAAGRTFHLTAGRENLVTAGDIVNGAVAYFNSSCGKQLEPVRFLPPALFRRMSEQAGGGLRRIARTLETYLPYLRRDVVFDNTNTRNIVGSRGLPGNLMSYYGPILRHCFRTDWGKQAGAFA